MHLARRPRGYRQWFQRVFQVFLIVGAPLWLIEIAPRVWHLARERRWGDFVQDVIAAAAVICALIYAMVRDDWSRTERQQQEPDTGPKDTKADPDFGQGIALGLQIVTLPFYPLVVANALFSGRVEDWMGVVLCMLFFIVLGVVRKHAERAGGGLTPYVSPWDADTLDVTGGPDAEGGMATFDASRRPSSMPRPPMGIPCWHLLFFWAVLVLFSATHLRPGATPIGIAIWTAALAFLPFYLMVRFHALDRLLDEWDRLQQQ